MPARTSSGRRTTRCRTGPPEVGVGPWAGPWPTGEQYDAQLLAEGDRRNVVDRYRYWTLEAIVADLDTRRHDFHVAIENWQHDFNIGTIVRTANAFLAREVHIVGNRRWNRRGAMVTDRYQHVRHHPDVDDLAAYLHEQGVPLMGVDNLPGLRARWRPGRCRAGSASCSGRRVRGSPSEARARVRRHLLDRAVRLDPLDQRLGGGGDRDAHLGRAVRRPRRGLAGLSGDSGVARRLLRHGSGSGRTGRRSSQPCWLGSWKKPPKARQQLWQRSRATGGADAGVRRAGSPEDACDPVDVRLRAGDVDAGSASGRCAAARARPGPGAAWSWAAGPARCRCGPPRRSAPTGRRAASWAWLGVNNVQVSIDCARSARVPPTSARKAGCADLAGRRAPLRPRG